MSPQLEVDIPLTDWFTHETLRMAGALAPSTFHVSNGSGSITGSPRGTVSGGSAKGKERANFPSEDAIEATSFVDTPSSEDLRRFNLGKPSGSRKPVTTPLQIPNAPIPIPQSKSRRSGHAKSAKSATSPHQSQGRSPQSLGASAISGTTLARALIGNSFVLSHDIPHSGPQSGRSGGRVDSATLPRGEHPFLNSPFWRDKRISGGDIVLTPNASDIPPVPPLPKALSTTENSGGTKRHKSTHETSRSGKSAPGIIPSLIRSSTTPAIHGPAAQPTSAASSQLQGDLAVASSIPNANMEDKLDADRSRAMSGSSQAPSYDKIRLAYEDSDVPLSEDEVPDRRSLLQPRKSHRRSYSDPSLHPNSPQAMSITNVIEGYMLTASGESNWSSASPNMPESNTGAAKPSPHHSTTPPRPNRARESSQITLHTNSAGKMTARADWVQRAKPAQENSKLRLLPMGKRGSLLVPHSPFTPGSTYRNSTIGARNSSVPSSIPVNPMSPRFVDGPDENPGSPDPFDGKLAPLSPPRFARQRSGSTPAPIAVVRNSAEMSHYITVNAEDNSSHGHSPPARSEHQTFPVTPNAFSPLWTGSIDGSHAHPTTPLQSAASDLTQPASVRRASSLSGAHQAPLAHKLLLSRAISVSGDKPTLINPRLNPVAEAKESATSSPASPNFQSLPSSSPSPIPSHTPPSTNEDIGRPVVATPAPINTPAPLGVTPPYSLSDFSSGSNASEVGQTSEPASPSPVPGILPTMRAVVSPQSSSPSNSSSSAPTTASGQSAFAPVHRRGPSNAEVVPTMQSTSQAVAPTPGPERLPPTSSAAHQAVPRRPSKRNLTVEPPPYDTIITGQKSAPQPQRGPRQQGGEPSVHKMGHSRLSSSSQLSSQNRSQMDNRTSRSRPPLPIGPRKPSLTQPLTPSAMGTPPDRHRSGSGNVTRTRNGSTSSPGGSSKNGGTGSSSSWRKTLARAPAPKFSTPAPKHRGYTMEAATWTFTSQQLQAIVSRAIKQTAAVSSVRLLQSETLDSEIPVELHHLDMQKMDIKLRYKAATRTRWSLLSALATQIEGVIDSKSALRMVAELTEVSTTLDNLADELHSVTQQIAQLRSLTEVHSASALAVALRKLNTSFLRQMAENTRLRQDIIALEDERDEAWKEAEDVAHEYDDLFDRYGGDEHDGDEHCGTSGPLKIPSSRRSSHVLAVRKSSIMASKGGLRHSLRRSHRSSNGSNGHRASGSVYSVAVMPPVPRKPQSSQLGAAMADFPSRSSMDFSPSEARAVMAKLQGELYEMLGIPMPESPRYRPRSRSQSLSSLRTPNARRASEPTIPIFRTSSTPNNIGQNFLISLTT
ncbi:hypothetical protein FIBSPDRAFT_814540 [Athelia psychrophila]|uniref:Uncharacterized protein n=1 Tax=Athelia psychrophila TaxID=1759441 RepID=A0A166TLY9_9AGAM|nr:hypothetical protein FIBSPDRAFT_814540 [Fibularhizoctonia sp. CBS 109695]